MSRIGRVPIPLPAGVDVSVAGDRVMVKGPQGEIGRQIPPPITLRQVTPEGSDRPVLVVERPDDERRSRALHGLTRSLLANMVTGVSSGFTKELEIVGVGYRASAQGPTRLEMALGFSHPVRIDAPAGITFDTPQPTRIIIKGVDKELVGQVAADIRKIRKPEPYKGKGIRYVGEVVRRKAGKAAK